MDYRTKKSKSMDIKKILIPTELDELSAKVIGFSVELAEQMNISEIVLLNIIIPAHTQSFSASGDVFAGEGHMTNRFNVLLMKKRQKLAETEAKKFTTDKVRIKPFVRFNHSKTDLNKYMREFEAGLIVCGSRDEHSFLQMLFGSDTEKIVRKLDYPLIIIQDEADAGKIHSILVAIDINEDDQSGLNEIADFAKALNARMQLLHVLTDDSQSSDQAIKKLRKLAVENMFGNYDINVMNNDSLEGGIRSFVRKHNPDMIAVLSQGKGKIHKLISGSSTEDIIKETDKPVFVSKIS
jgi:nucleotide-binding universal stress UspA family protein